MSYQKVKTNSHCVGCRRHSAIISIERESTKTGQHYHLVIVFNVTEGNQ